MLERVPLFALLIGSQGCIFDSVVQLDPAAKHVTVVRETTRPVECKPLGKITGTSRSGEEKLARAGAENEFRNEAAKLKANYALVEVLRSKAVGTTSKREVFIGGRALYCRTLEMDEADEARREKARLAKEESELKAAAEKERKAEEAAAEKERKAGEAKESDAKGKK